ncbi:MAG: hypothetical protein ACI9KN_001677 [Gammaproteobacteria bacterium]|jgi:hypothetical protein
MTLSNTAAKKSEFFSRGWCQFDFDARLASWVESALRPAQSAVLAAEHAQWLRCGGTWFAGVNVLPNAIDGSIGLGPKLSGVAVDFIAEALGLDGFEWDRAQVSVCYPSYPKPMDAETEAAFRFRRDRDAAHVDGLLPEGSTRRRFLRELHGFILAIPMLECSPKAAPFVVWEGSQQIVRQAFQAFFDDKPPSDWSSLDITEVYHAVRRQVFEQCKRVEIHAKPGEAYLVHRLSLHGMAPWKDSTDETGNARMICYFRPGICEAAQWLNSP